MKVTLEDLYEKMGDIQYLLTQMLEEMKKVEDDGEEEGEDESGTEGQDFSV